MTTLEFLKLSFLKPNEIWKITQNPLKSSKLVIVILTWILMFPGLIQMNRLFTNLERDMVALDEKLPDFTVDQGKLQVDGNSTGFVYRTDTLSFIFDASGKTTSGDLMNETSSGIPAFGLLKDGFYLETNLSSQKFDYAQLNGVNKQWFSDLAKMLQRNHWLSMLIFTLAYFVFNYIYLLIVLIIISLAVRLLTAVFMRVMIQFPRNIGWQVTIASAVLPIIFYAVLDLLGINFIGPGEFLFFSASMNWVLGMRELFNQQQ